MELPSRRERRDSQRKVFLRSEWWSDQLSVVCANVEPYLSAQSEEGCTSATVYEAGDSAGQETTAAGSSWFVCVCVCVCVCVAHGAEIGIALFRCPKDQRAGASGAHS